MKINLSKHVRKHTLLGDCFLGSVTDEIMAAVLKSKDSDGNLWGDLTLTLNGHELDIEPVFAAAEKQFLGMVEEAAKELLSDKFRVLTDLLVDLEERVQPEIKKRLEEWEEE